MQLLHRQDFTSSLLIRLHQVHAKMLDLPKHLLTIDGTSLWLMYTGAKMEGMRVNWHPQGKDYAYQYHENCAHPCVPWGLTH